MTIWNQEQREQTAMGRFEIVCEMYLEGGEEAREIILNSFDTEEERQTFLKGCGLYHLFSDPAFYRAAKDILAEQLYKEFTT